jgi:hypothetical protein
MLEKLEFEAQTGGGQPEIRRIDLDNRGPSDLGADQPLSLGNIVSIDAALNRGIHISTRHMGLTNVFGAANPGPNRVLKKDFWRASEQICFGEGHSRAQYGR